MSDTTGRHRAPGRYNPVAEIGQIVTQAGTPLAKGSAVLAASGGLVAAIAIPAQAATSDDVEAAPAKQQTLSAQAVTPATTAVTAPQAAESTAKATSSFGKVEVEPVAKPTGPTPYQLRLRAERQAEREQRAAAWEQQKTRVAERQQERRDQAAAAQREREEQEAAQQQAQEQETQEQAPQRTEQSSPSRSQERQSPAPQGSSSQQSSAPSSSSSSSVIAIAKQYIGTPYVFGGSTPAGFDCSGFTQYVFAKAGKSIPRVTTAQQAAATPVSDPQPGDLVFFGSPSYHVGIYLGNGQMIDAPRTGSSISIRPVFDGVSGYGRV